MYNKIYDKIKHADFLLVIFYTLCCITGILLVLSLTVNSRYQTITGGVSSALWKTKIAAILIGGAASLVLGIIGAEKICRFWIPISAFGLLLTCLTFTPLGIGPEGSDDVAWLSVFGRTIQPTELLKLCFIISFSVHLSKVREKINKPLVLLGLLGHISIPVILCFLQKDQGTSVVFIFIGVVMLIGAGLHRGYIIGALALSPAVLYAVWNFGLAQYQKDRILVLFNPEYDPFGVGYQQICGMNALRSGGLFGKGLFSADKTEFIYVAEAQNDFIFSYAGQTMGFVGCALIVILLAAVCIRLIIDSRKCEPLGADICIGVFALIFSHTLINIGMVLGFMPVIGVPLPFISAGGTAMVSMLTAMGLVHAALKKPETKNNDTLTL